MCWLLAWLAGSLAQAQPSASVEPAKTTAEIRIGLPAGVPPRVTLSPGTDRLVLELPREAVFPLDFVSSSGGLVRGSKVDLVGDRLRLELELAQGLLDQVDYAPDAIVLRFQSRFELLDGLSGPQNQYLLGAGDKIKIMVHDQPELTSERVINGRGQVTAPLVNEVQAAGLSTRQLAAKLAELLGVNYIVDPQVDVQVLEYNSQWVSVEGPVREPGRIPLRGATRLREVLSEAGGFDDRNGAGEEIIISREAEGGGPPVSLTVDRSEFERGESNPILAHGDMIRVNRAEVVYIQGEVLHPGPVSLERDTTLLRAIVQVGGLTQWADRKNVRVIYEDQGTPRESVFNVKLIMEGKAQDPRLEGGALIIVRRRFL